MTGILGWLLGCFLLLTGWLPLPLHGQASQLVPVSAASFTAPVAPDSIVSTFGAGLATATASAETLPLPTRLAGTTVSVTDSRGVERLASLLYVSPGQANFLVPPETAIGSARVTIRNADGGVSTGAVEIRAFAPGLFTANNSGRGVPAALALRTTANGSRITSPLARWESDRKVFVGEPIAFGLEGDQLFLQLFGTGIRGSSRAVAVSLGGEPVPVQAAGPQGSFAGLDQVNIGPLPRSLAGRDEAVLALTVDGIPANGASVAILSPPAPGGWGRRAELIEANSEMAVTELDGKLYVIGGYPASRITVSTVQVYDPATGTWKTTTPLPVALNHLMAVPVDGKLYAIGGQTTSGNEPFVDTVYEYDPAAATWTPRAPMPTARSAGAAAVVDGKIYVAGGRPPRGADFAVYDPRANKWTVLPDLPTQRNHLAVAAIEGKIYVVGGRFQAGFTSPQTDAVEMFDPVTGSWSARARMLSPRGGINGVAALGCFHVFGGEGTSEFPNGVYPHHDVYNPATDTWTRLSPMPVPVHGVTGLAFLNGLIYFPGGGISEGGSSGSTLHQVYRPSMECR